MRQEVDVPFGGARAERDGDKPRGAIWFRGAHSDLVKVEVPVELAAAAALRGARVRLVVEVDEEVPVQKVAGRWERSPGGRWVRRVDYKVAAEVSFRPTGQHQFDWAADGAGRAKAVCGTAEGLEAAQLAADSCLRAQGWELES